MYSLESWIIDKQVRLIQSFHFLLSYGSPSLSPHSSSLFQLAQLLNNEQPVQISFSFFPCDNMEFLYFIPNNMEFLYSIPNKKNLIYLRKIADLHLQQLSILSSREKLFRFQNATIIVASTERWIKFHSKLTQKLWRRNWFFLLHRLVQSLMLHKSFPTFKPLVLVPADSYCVVNYVTRKKNTPSRHWQLANHLKHKCEKTHERRSMCLCCGDRSAWNSVPSTEKSCVNWSVWNSDRKCSDS